VKRFAEGHTGLPLLLLLATVLLAADWSSYRDDLDTLGSRASDASDTAERVSQAADELDTKRQEQGPRDPGFPAGRRLPGSDQVRWNQESVRQANRNPLYRPPGRTGDHQAETPSGSHKD